MPYPATGRPVNRAAGNVIRTHNCLDEINLSVGQAFRPAQSKAEALPYET